jgi:glycosyltransferase involved in cell wall biosynthesis
MSVLGQTLSDLEVIVVDDGSTDDTSEVVRSVGDPRITVMSQENAGHAAARNTGISVAQGTYVAVVDADDLWLPDKLERQLRFLKAHPRTRALHSSAIHVDDSLRPLFIGKCRDGPNRLLDVLCMRRLPGFMCTLIVERSLLGEIGGFDSSLVILQDWDLAIRLAWCDELYSTSDPVVLYRVHATNQSKQLDLHIEPGERILARVFADPSLPQGIRNRRGYVYSHFYAMLCGGALQLRRFQEAAYWARKAVEADARILPHLTAFPARRLQKRISRRSARRLISAGSMPAQFGIELAEN